MFLMHNDFMILSFVGLNCIVVEGPNLSPSSLKISIYLLIVGLDVNIGV